MPKRKIEGTVCYGRGHGATTGAHSWNPLKNYGDEVIGRQCGACHRTEVFASCPTCGARARVELHQTSFCKCQSAAAKG